MYTINTWKIEWLSLGSKGVPRTFKSRRYFFSLVSSVQSLSHSLWPHGPQHARRPCPSPTPRVYPSSCPLSLWCHLTISSSVVPFSSYPQSFPAPGSCQVNQLFASGGQSIGVSISTSMNTQDWSLTGWLVGSPCSQFFSIQLFSQSSSLIHTWPLEKP